MATKLRVPAVLVVSLVVAAGCRSDDCVERCVPVMYRDAGVADVILPDANACTGEPDPQTGECAPGCEPTFCFT